MSVARGTARRTSATRQRRPTPRSSSLDLWSHGYRQSTPTTPGGKIETHPESALSAEAAKILLAMGYALAGSAYAHNGWAVTDGVTAANRGIWKASDAPKVTAATSTVTPRRRDGRTLPPA